jgi:hypothetical protein
MNILKFQHADELLSLLVIKSAWNLNSFGFS